jgi:hypothetical protein
MEVDVRINFEKREVRIEFERRYDYRTRFERRV